VKLADLLGYSDILGMGFKCGFLGLLHMDVFMQRLRQEYSANVIATAPNVSLKGTRWNEVSISLLTGILVDLRDGTTVEVTSPAGWPEKELVLQVHEPLVRAVIMTPKEFMGGVINLCIDRRGEQLDLTWMDEKRLRLVYRMPLSEIIFDFFDKLKQLSSGYAT